MDANIQRALNDKLYDKRKIGALEYVPSPLQSWFSSWASNISWFSLASLSCQAPLLFSLGEYSLPSPLSYFLTVDHHLAALSASFESS